MRALIIDDHRLFGEAVRALLIDQGIEVVGLAENGEEGCAMARRERPDLVLVDLGLPDRDGVQIGASIIDALPDAKVVALTASTDARAVRDAIRSGFHGFLTKDTSTPRFMSAIKAVLEGQAVIPHHLGRRAAGATTPEDRAAALLAEQLTPRELDVLALLVEGLAGNELARRLSISPNTVRTHVQSILTKLQVRSRLEAAAFAVRHGIVNTRRTGRAGRTA